MEFSSESKVKDIALANAAAKQVLEETGLDYCCGGAQTLQEACLHAGIPKEEILRRLRENAKNIDADAANWLAVPLRELTRHIREKHHYYVREAIPRTQALLDKVVAQHGNNHPEVAEIRVLFGQLARELIMHMQKEEQILFPYIDAVELAAEAHASLETPFFLTMKNPIHAMMKEHDAAGELVRQIRARSGQYALPAEACPSYRALYEALQEFEADLHQHVHLENNVLFPRAVEMEAAVA